MMKREINFKVNLSYGSQGTLGDSADGMYYFYVFWGIVMPVIVIFGLVGNGLTMFVLFRRDMRSATIYYLRALAVTDTLILIMAFLMLSLYMIATRTKALRFFEHVIFPQIYGPFVFMSLSVQMINVWTTVAVSVERYISICHPFKAGKIISKKITLLVILVISLVSIVYNVPRAMASTFSPCANETLNTLNQSVTNTSNNTSNHTSDHTSNYTSNHTGNHTSNHTSDYTSNYSLNNVYTISDISASCYVLTSTDFSVSPGYKIYKTWLYITIMFIIPLTSLSAINFLIVRELMAMRDRTRNTNIQSDDESNLSLALVLIVVIFILCQTLSLLAQFDSILPEEEFYKFLAVSNTVFVLNSSINFLVYAAVGRKFRTILKREVLGCCVRNVRKMSIKSKTNGYASQASQGHSPNAHTQFITPGTNTTTL